MSELFVAIRCEELPARFVEPAVSGLERAVLGLLKGIEHGAVRTWATPRRVAVAVADVAPARPVQEQVVTGPPEAAAFKGGQPTPAAVGFARGRGVPVESLEIVDSPKGRVVAARVTSGGERTAEIVAAGLEAAILGIPFPKTMRWGSRKVGWARPIHGVVALLGGELIGASVAGVPTSASTVGHRLAPGTVAVTGSESWLLGLRACFVEPDPQVRRERIVAQLRAAAAGLGASVEPYLDLVDEVVNLVEWPVVIPAEFAADLLDLPPRLLVEAMKVHQRTFPLEVGGRLSSRYLVVTNHPWARTDPEAQATIATGNSKVIAARFIDAKFFYAEDRKKRLDAHGRGLADMAWIRKGGTMADKARRLWALAERLAPLLGADPARATRAAALCKADLRTQMVGEFPELQGHVGRLLAAHQGEDERVAVAIEEHYLPRFAGDALPASPEGRVLALADRIDTLTGCFALGLKPKGSADPLGLRRAANGLALVVVDAGLRLEVGALLALAEHPVDAELVDFCLARFRAQQLEGHATDVVDAVLATGDRDLVALAERIAALDRLSGQPDFGPLKTTFKRVMGLTREHLDATWDEGAFTEPAERDLAAAFVRVRDQVRSLGADAALARLATLRPAVDRLFDEVFVMANDPVVRAARLGLLRAIAQEFRAIADFTLLSA